MTSQPNNPENVVDELAGAWFDSESWSSKQAPSSNEIRKSLTQEQTKRLTDLQLVHSLLLQAADRDKAAKERRVQKVMQSIIVTKTFYRITRPLVRYGAVAAIILLATILLTQLPSNTAMAAIDQMISAIDHSGDRTYSFTVRENQRTDPRQRLDRLHERTREPSQRASLDGATLYLRGNNQYVLYRQTQSDKTLINGNDGQTRWLIRPDKPVLVSNNPEAFSIPMPPELAAILSLDLKATLLHIREHYKVKHLGDIADDRQQDRSLKYLNARKINRDFPGPKNIEIWTEAETGLLLRIEFSDIRLQGDPLPKRLIIKLDDPKALPDNWFTRQTHHSQDAEVDFISE